MSSIRKNIGTGVFYTALAKYSNVFIGIFISAILARLLSPAEFGIVAIVSVFTRFFYLLSNFGLSAAVVQNKALTKEDNESIFAFSLLFGFLLALLFYLAAPIISSFYNDFRLISLVHLMSLAILFQSLRVVPYALTEKKLRFKEIGIINVIVNLVSGLVAIILAYKGFSYYALIINSILSGFLIFIAFFIITPVRLTFNIKINSIKKIAKFSTFQFLFNIINYFANNTDNLLIGKFIGNAALGYYDKSYRLMRMPIKNLTYTITPVLHPVLSEYQNDKKIIYNTYYKIVKLLATIGFPLSIFLYFSASEIINIIYGPQWNQSIPVFKLLALLVGIHIILSTSGSIFQATNRTDLLFYAGLFGSGLVISGVLVGIFVGNSLVAVAYGLIVATVINFFQAFYLLIKRALSYPLLIFLKVLILPLITSVGVAIALWFFSYLKITNNIYSVILKGLITLFVFGIFFLSSKENQAIFYKYYTKIFKKNKI